MGDIISLDDGTSKRLRFSVGKIKISTELLENVNQVIFLESKGESYPVKVIENQVVIPSIMNANLNLDFNSEEEEDDEGAAEVNSHDDLDINERQLDAVVARSAETSSSIDDISMVGDSGGSLEVNKEKNAMMAEVEGFGMRVSQQSQLFFFLKLPSFMLKSE